MHRQMTGRSVAWIIFGHQLVVNIPQCIHDLEVLAVFMEPSALVDRGLLPLR
jgi:hypothetical protein